MQPNLERHLLWLAIGVGVVLRMIALDIPDLATDEAQAAFGVSPAWTPLGMMILRLAQAAFGREVLVIRGVSVLFGLATLPLLFLLARFLLDRKTSLLVTAVAAIFPSHILFSRLAYLSVQLGFWWILTLFAFLKARREPRTPWFVLLFFASVAATMTKTQGLLLPLLLALGTMFEQFRSRKLSGSSEKCVMPSERAAVCVVPRYNPAPSAEGTGSLGMTQTAARLYRGTRFSEVPVNYQLSIFWTLILSLVPVTLYILTHPGIAATLLLYGGNMYGLSDIGTRIATLVSVWWNLLSLFLIAMVVSARSLKRLPWPVLVLLLIATLTGLVLGPGHGYYSTHLVLFAVPIAITLATLRPSLRIAALFILLLTTLALLGPWRTPWSNPLFAERGFWNTHAKEINETLEGEKAVTVLGSAGHHIRWYLAPRVLIGRNMEPPYPTDHVVLLGISEAALVSGTVEYATEEVAIVRQGTPKGEIMDLRKTPEPPEH